MIFKPNATVTELWCYPADCKKAKRQGVSGRDFHSLTFRLTGQISVLACGQNLISSPGCITYVPQGQAYVTEVIEETTMLAVNFHAAQTVLSPVPWVHKAQDQKKFLFLFHRLLETRRSGSETDYRCLSVFYEILAEIEREMEQSAGRQIDPRILAAKKYIDENFSDDLTVAALASDAGFSETYFRELFRNAFGVAPNGYLKTVRIENARLLLRAGYYSVSEVASNCGFDSPSYFAYEFRRATGMTPRDYVRSNR